MNQRVKNPLCIDMSGVPFSNLWHPTVADYKRFIEQDGIVVFDLAPYKMVQMVVGEIKTAWYYVDTGIDGVAVLGFTDARKVLEQTVEWHQEAVRRAIEKVKP